MDAWLYIMIYLAGYFFTVYLNMIWYKHDDDSVSGIMFLFTFAWWIGLPIILIDMIINALYVMFKRASKKNLKNEINESGSKR